MPAHTTGAEVRVLGVRHFSPACAHRVRRHVLTWRPDWVLVEGPSDFNSRLDELFLPHRLPLAIYSYAVSPLATRHGFTPMVEFAPEWAALSGAREIGAQPRFVDLPFAHKAFQDGTLRYDQAARHGDARYRAALNRMCARFGIDSDEALWDTLFEQACAPEDLDARMDLWFRELRGDFEGAPDDAAREAFMARWTAWAATQGRRVLVVCGGWHQAAIERLWPSLSPEAEPPVAERENGLEDEGSWLTPWSDRQLDAYSGYGAGMPSPQYYRWLWKHGMAGAAERAFVAVAARLRERKQPLSTASLVQARARLLGLARVRAHPEPTRNDVLDGLLDALVDQALDTPPPWSQRGSLQAAVDPRLREALLALTGPNEGTLAEATPLPPLIADLERMLERLDLRFEARKREYSLDRRNPLDESRGRLLSQLGVLRISGISRQALPRAQARSLSADQTALEQWRIERVREALPDLIRAGALGPTVESAAQRALAERLGFAESLVALVDCVVEAVRCGFTGLGTQALISLQAAIDRQPSHGDIGAALLRIGALAEHGFWGRTLADLLGPVMEVLCDRLCWLLETLEGETARACEADIVCVQAMAQLLRIPLDTVRCEAMLALAERRGRASAAPPALRGALLALAWLHARLPVSEITRQARAIADSEQLGDFLSGVFAIARQEASRDQDLIRAIDAVVCAMDVEALLCGLPALRAAFAWLPPRERGLVAESVAQLHGASMHAAVRLTQAPLGVRALTHAHALERAVVARREHWGLTPEEEA